MSKAKEYEEALRAIGRKSMRGIGVMEMREEIERVEQMRKEFTPEDHAELARMLDGSDEP